MATTDLATNENVSAALRRSLTPEELSAVPELITYASAVLRQAARQRGCEIDQQIAADRLDPVLVAGVVGRMVKRALQQPDDPNIAIDVAGPTSTTFRTPSTDDVYATPRELQLIAPVPAYQPAVIRSGAPHHVQLQRDYGYRRGW